jgi:hypothetical protein
LAPELDLQIEIDRLAIQEFVTNRVAQRGNSVIYSAQSEEKRTSPLNKLRDMGSPTKLNETTPLDLSNEPYKSLKASLLDFVPKNQATNVSPPPNGNTSPSSKTVDTNKSVAKRKDK